MQTSRLFLPFLSSTMTTYSFLFLHVIAFHPFLYIRHLPVSSPVIFLPSPRRALKTLISRGPVVLTGLFFVESDGFHTSLLGSWGTRRLYPCRPAELWPETFIFQRHPGWDRLARLNRALILTDYSITFHCISSHSLLHALLFPLLFSHPSFSFTSQSSLFIFPLYFSIIPQN